MAKGLSLGQGASVSVSSSQADGGDIDIETTGEVSLAKSELTASAAKKLGSALRATHGWVMYASYASTLADISESARSGGFEARQLLRDRLLETIAVLRAILVDLVHGLDVLPPGVRSHLSVDRSKSLDNGLESRAAAGSCKLRFVCRAEDVWYAPRKRKSAGGQAGAKRPKLEQWLEAQLKARGEALKA